MLEQAKDPSRGPEPVHEVLCLEAPADPIPRCSESRTAQLELPLARVIYLDWRGSVLEAGGLIKSARWPKRADKNDAAFVEIEGGSVTKLVREPAEIRAAFMDQSGGYRLHSHLADLSLWRDVGTSLELGVADYDGGSLLAVGGATNENILLAYASVEDDEQRKTKTPVVRHTTVRVTSGPPSEWTLAPWRSIMGATSPAFHLTGRGAVLTAFEPGGDGAQASLVVLPLAEGSTVERFPLARPGWHVRELGDVRRVGERWVALSAVESELVVGPKPTQERSHEPPVCAKPPSLPPPERPSERLDPGFDGGPQPGQGAIAVVSHGPEGSRSLILETGLGVWPGHMVELDGTRVAVSFCTGRPNYCYLAVVSLDQDESLLCVTQGGPTPLALDGDALLWVERRYPKTDQLDRSPALQGLALRRAQPPPR